jgi:hypothetical protein
MQGALEVLAEEGVEVEEAVEEEEVEEEEVCLSDFQQQECPLSRSYSRCMGWLLESSTTQCLLDK